ncbi:MAG: serine/threonine-protein kinase [Polyangiaceae bacterium]
MAEPSMRVGDLLERRFRLDHLVGSGAMGLVFRAKDLAVGGDVAVKVLKRPDSASGTEEASRFEREAEILLALQHPSVVRYVAHGRTSAAEPFLVMEWLVGETLKARMERAPLTLPETIDVGLALASALSGAHARGVVHRDVKPANVYLVRGSTSLVKLLDFGVARTRTGRALTEAGTAIGTPAYMSPEQATGERDVAAPSDVFSLGTLLFELVSGARPFDAEELLDMLMKLTIEPAPPLASRAPSAPIELAALVDGMLAKTPASRPTMAEVFARLTEARQRVAPDAPTPHLAAVAAQHTMVHAPAFALPPPAVGARRPRRTALTLGLALGGSRSRRRRGARFQRARDARVRRRARRPSRRRSRCPRSLRGAPSSTRRRRRPHRRAGFRSR